MEPVSHLFFFLFFFWTSNREKKRSWTADHREGGGHPKAVGSSPSRYPPFYVSAESGGEAWARGAQGPQAGAHFCGSDHILRRSDIPVGVISPDGGVLVRGLLLSGWSSPRI